MTAITEINSELSELIDKLAKSAGLNFEESEKNKLQEDLSRILAFVKQIEGMGDMETIGNKKTTTASH